MKIAEIYGVFQEARKVFGNPTLGLKVDESNKDDNIFILNNMVTIPIKYCDTYTNTKDLFMHEMGHPAWAPKTLSNHYGFMRLMREIVNVDTDQLTHHLLNAIYDLIINERLTREQNSKMMETHQDMIKKAQPNFNSDFTLSYLMQTSNLILGEERHKVTNKDALDNASKTYDILKETYRTLHYKVEEIIKILKFKIEENPEQMSKSLSKVFNNANGNNSMSTQDSTDSKTQEEYKEKVMREEISDGDDEDAMSDYQGNSYSKSGEVLNVKIGSADVYRAKAKKNLRIHAPSFKYNSGKTENAGFISWRPEEDPELLEVEETLCDTGIMIPEITTLRKDFKKGTDEIGKGTPDIIVVLDTSGSMNRNKGLTALFTFLETARFYNVKAGVMMFHSQPYFYNAPTNKYNDLEDELVNSFCSGGTTIQRAVDKLHNENLKDKFIVMITDWCDINPDSIAKSFSKLSPANKICSVRFSDWGRGELDKPGFELIDIKSLDELDNMMIKITESVVM